MVDELTLSSPLLLPAADGVQVQVVVGAADGSGRRAVSVYSLGAQPGSEWASKWALHAEGVLSTGSPAPAADLSLWPPVGALAMDVTDAYRAAGRRGATSTVRRFGVCRRCGGSEMKYSPKSLSRRSQE